MALSASAALRIDVTRSLEDGAWSPFQKIVLALAALAFTVDGLANQVLGLALPALIRDWGLARQAFAPVAALGLVGVALGTALGGLLGDRYGRRAGLIGSLLLFGVMTAVAAGARSLDALLALRFLAGLGIGGAIPNGAALIFELTPVRLRGAAIALSMTFVPVGGVVSGLLGAWVLPRWGWRALFLVSGALPVLLAIAFVFVLPESPRFLARLPRHRAALLALLRRCGQHIDASSELIAERARAVHAPLAELFGAELLHDTLALWVAFFFCLLASYSLFSWVPTLLMGAGFPLSMTSLGMTAFNLGGMIGGVAGGWLIACLGSRAAVLGLAGAASLGAVALGVLPLDVHAIRLAMLALLIEGFFIGGLHNGLYTVAAFLYPPFARATGIGAASGTGRIGAVLSSFTGVLALQLGGSSGYFWLVAGACALALVGSALVRRHVPRTLKAQPFGSDLAR